jgi:phosphoribosylamine--glycine ligase
MIEYGGLRPSKPPGEIAKEVKMNVLVVGGGGREHAIIQALRKNAEIEKIYALPGNGGIAKHAVCVDVKATDVPGIVAFARNNPVDFAVVAPDDPLVLGCVDALTEIGVACFGPNKAAAIIEGSKAFSKDLMKKYGIPTAASETFTDLPAAVAYIGKMPAPMVVKADGLALGKGVLICETKEDAVKAAASMLEGGAFGASGAKIVIEEFLEGPEVSVLSFTDGNVVVPMVSSMDHKRALDGDRGLNTGGMGAVAPNPYYTDKIAAECMEQIFLPTIRAMKEEGREFRGCLYFGLMLTKDGPKVIEYNCRFGDPETQVVLPLLKTDLYTILRATAESRLSEVEIEFARDKFACCVVIASKGYPEKYQSGVPIELPETGENEFVYAAGAKIAEGSLVSAGGRVVGLTATGDTLAAAVAGAYALADRVKFDNGTMRRDIGARAMKAVV